MHKVFPQYGVLFVTLLALAGYWAVAPLMDDGPQTEWLRSFQFVLFTAGVFVFATTLRKMFRGDVPSSAQRFLLGLILFLIGADAGSTWRLLWRLGGSTHELDWMITNDFAGFMIWMEIVGVFLMISGPSVDSEPNKPERINWRRMAWVTVTCLAVAGALRYFEPDPSEWLTSLQPYFAPKYYEAPIR